MILQLFSGTGKILLYGGALLVVFYIYLLFTQPQNALYYVSIFFTAVFRVIMKIFYVVYKVLEALINFIVRLFKKK